MAMAISMVEVSVKDKRQKTNNNVSTYMLVHVAWDVGNIEVGVCLIRELLELGIERFLNTSQ